jgi:hypothetical protein
MPEPATTPEIKGRKKLKGFMDKIKDGLIDLFNEETDNTLESSK